MVNGSKTKGIIEANNLVEARNQLKSKKLRIVDIKEKNDNTFSTRKKGKKLKPDTISHFCRQFSIIMSSGINSLVGLETLAKRTENKVLANEIDVYKRQDAQTSHMIEAFEKAAKEFGAEIEVETSRMYSPLNIDENDDIVEFTKKAFANLNIEGKTASTGGGSDTNVLNKNGVKAVNLGIGMKKAHTCLLYTS